MQNPEERGPRQHAYGRTERPAVDKEKQFREGGIHLRYYIGHKGKFGHEFLEFEFMPNGRLRYANNSQYKAD